VTTVVVIRSTSSACVVCGGSKRVSMHFPGRWVDIGFVDTDCLHCVPRAPRDAASEFLPAVFLPVYKDKRTT
jgi:hypothetical protein